MGEPRRRDGVANYGFNKFVIVGGGVGDENGVVDTVHITTCVAPRGEHVAASASTVSATTRAHTTSVRFGRSEST